MRILIVSPHFPPLNAPDMQRVRLSLPHFVRAGCEVTVLAAEDPTPLPPVEPELLATVPPKVRVVRVRAWSRRWTRFLGCNSLGPRLALRLFRAGTQLLRRERFDVVYFSTTQFFVVPFGRLWRARFGVPFVVDLQDPWWNDYYERTGAPPPGGWKYRFARAQAKLLEGWTLRQAAHVIAVSEHYLTQLAQRYDWWRPERGTVIEFGAPDEDLASLRESPAPVPDPGTLVVAYAGRLGNDMLTALDILFRGLAQARGAGVRVRAEFFGTTYAPAATARGFTGELAARHGTTDAVIERPERISYLRSLEVMLRSDVNLLIGSDDLAYSPSKTWPTLFAGRPILALAPRGSVLESRLKGIPGIGLVAFDRTDPDGAANATRDYLCAIARARPAPGTPPPWASCLPAHSAAAAAERQLVVLAAAVRESVSP